MELDEYKVVGIILCRTGSKRLPNKALMPLAGRPMVQRYIERCQRIEGIDELVLATTEGTKDDILCEIAKMEGIGYFRGSEDDVIDRLLRCAEKHEAELVVRLCADNPLIEPKEVERLIGGFCHKEYLHSNAGDFADIADGLGAELYHIDALRWLDERAEGEDREHPHKLFGDLGMVITIPLSENFTKVKLDVNTIDEYEFVSAIYDVYGSNPNVKEYIEEVARWQEELSQETTTIQ